jgi:aryl-alcohol dehydrogenase-like predicted oxidoreductase
MFTRKLGRSGIQVSAMGLGCWAIGGPWTWSDRRAMGWGQVDDTESIRAIHKALDLGINLFDTAANYGTGHSERILGQAVGGRRDKVVIATKFGHIINEETRVVHGDDNVLLENIRHDCENSLRRLNTDYIDVYQLHAGQYDPVKAVDVVEVLEELVAEGKIRAYGWSTDDPERARVFAQGEHCAAIQVRLHMFHPADDVLAVCEEYDVGSINKGPLSSGLLTGKFSADSKIADPQEWRSRVDFKEKGVAEFLGQLDTLRDVLTSDGRTLAQAVLSWIWTHSERTVPIPGFKTVEQVEENVRAMEFGPLSDEQMAAVANARNALQV